VPRPVGSAEEDLVEALRPEAVQRLGELEGEAFLARLHRVRRDLEEPLCDLYGQLHDVAVLLRALAGIALDAAASRPWPLRVSDRRREADPGWFQGPEMVGYACYADRFGGTLAGVRAGLDHLSELGVTYLHLMPPFASREGPDDGGYAVTDYDAVDPRLGTMAELEQLAAGLRARGISLCLDLVLNHTAKEHPWAQRAAAGDPHYRSFYIVFPDRTGPDAYEATLPDVFPDAAPGSFTHVPEMGGWVWTTFNDYQWDLDYRNPAVFAATVTTALRLANRGVDVLRLDAVPFLWRRLGTDCRNLPETHLLTQAFCALVRLAAPGVLVKAEAIVGPDDVVRYLGAHDAFVPECDLAYHNQLMVLLWSSVATKDARLARRVLARMRPAPASTSWLTFVRNHDDIGWAVTDADAASVGWDATAHRRFLNDWFSGRFPGSDGRGAVFGADPRSGDARITGTTAALCGLTAALDGGSASDIESALRRFETLYAVVFSFGGMPLLWMGDEIGLGDDPDWATEPAHAADGRWSNRPAMDWAKVARRTDRRTPEGQVYARISALVGARRRQPALRAGGETQVLEPDSPGVLAYSRRHGRSGPLIVLANLSDRPASIRTGLLAAADVNRPAVVLATADGLSLAADRLELEPWAFAWLGQDG
jgi:amylosucrase